MTRNRPFGLSVLSLGFLCAAIAAFVFARHVWTNPASVAALGAAPRSIIGGTLLFGLCAAWAAAAAWARSRWLLWAIAFAAVSLAVIAAMVQRALGTQGDPLWMAVLPYALLAMIVWILVAFTVERL